MFDPLPLALTTPAWAAYAPPEPLPPLQVRDPARPLVSVVTPSLNQGRYLAATLRSVLEQDYPNLEYWVIDGGSQDGTLAVLHTFATDPRLNWLSEPDRGQSDAINKGWGRSRGGHTGLAKRRRHLLPRRHRCAGGRPAGRSARWRGLRRRLLH